MDAMNLYCHIIFKFKRSDMLRSLNVKFLGF